MEYKEVVKLITELPRTWYPALIIHMVEAAYKKNVFIPGGATKLIEKIEKRIEKCHSKAKSNANI